MDDSIRLRGDSGVLQVKGRTYSVREVYQAAAFRGELRSRWRDFAFASACARVAEDLGLAADADALEAMSEEFRYERDLVAAEETEAWLEDRGATVDDFDDYFVRRYWARELPADQRPEAIDHPDASNELDDTFAIDLVLSGDFFRIAERLGRRAAAFAAAGDHGAPTPEAVAQQRTLLAERSGIPDGRIPPWLSTEGVDPAWLEELLRLEAVYVEHCRGALGERERLRLLQSMRLSLTRFEVETIALDSLDAAREAVLCVRDDGIEMAELAKEQGCPYHRIDLLLDELDDDRQRLFLAAPPGDVLQPIEDEGRYVVCRLVRKVEPDLSDERVARRIDGTILDTHFAELTMKEVRWLIPNETAA